MTAGAESRSTSGVLVVPDVVANAGGVIARLGTVAPVGLAIEEDSGQH
jgi:glutamate dehydrogenase/leucine dehydrogenase